MRSFFSFLFFHFASVSAAVEISVNTKDRISHFLGKHTLICIDTWQEWDHTSYDQFHDIEYVGFSHRWK